MKWNLEPMLTKNVVMFCTYTKGDQSLTHATYYRWGLTSFQFWYLTIIFYEFAFNAIL